MSCNIFEKIKNDYYKNNNCISVKDINGKTIEYCGCMLSKWISVQFQKIIADKVYLFTTIIYMEPFTGSDSFAFCMKFSDIEKDLCNLYNLASNRSNITIYDDYIEMYIPYVYKSGRTVIRIPNKSELVSDISDVHVLI